MHRIAFFLSVVLCVSVAIAQDADPSTLVGKVMCGYQGWHHADGDGSEFGWTHYNGANGKFEPGNCCFDLWPDMSEMEDDEKFATPFKNADGSTAYVFSPHVPKTVARHFRWMKENKIDGVFLQRFIGSTTNEKRRNARQAVMKNVRAGAAEHGRTWAMMYDLSGANVEMLPNALIDDWKRLIDEDKITSDKTYQKHAGKPVVSVWGIGFNDNRKYTLKQCLELVTFLKDDPKYGGNTVMLGVPTYWRELKQDSVGDPMLHEIILKADIVSPWTVGRYGSPKGAYRYIATTAYDDLAWCTKNGKEFLPVVFPGFSWHNLMKARGTDAPLNSTPRLQGDFLRSQYTGHIDGGVRMIYQAMFDEIDEGTAIFKCTNNPPVGASPFSTYEGLPGDYYLKLVGNAAEQLKRSPKKQPKERPTQIPLPPAPGKFVTNGTGVDFGKETPVVATSYFYWYDAPSKAHLVNADGTDALTDHPPTIDGMSWKSVDWHRSQLIDIEEAGIDVVLPVYWGTPEKPRPTELSFSNEGLPPLVAAREKLLAEGKKPASIGMFYDTSTLMVNGEKTRIDLTTDDGKCWFYATIRDFFSLIPAQHRVTVEGKPVVFLYSSGFARSVDDTLFPAVKKMFRRDFGCDLYIVKEASFPGQADSVYQWGGAVKPKLLDTAAVGPGYDHSAVPGRTPLVTPRDDGRFYSFAWEQLLLRDPKTRSKWVHVETWSEFHEGTEICETKEYGRKYIDLTKKYADMFHAGKQLKEVSFKPKFSSPNVSPTTGEGIAVTEFGRDHHGDGPLNIRNVDWADGGDTQAWYLTTDAKVADGGRYLYFRMADPYFLAVPGAAYEVVVEYLPPKDEASCCATVGLQYDCADPTLSGVQRHFRGAPSKNLTEDEKQSRQWKTAVFPLKDPAFAGGTNGSDFRLSISSGEIYLRKVTLRITK